MSIEEINGLAQKAFDIATSGLVSRQAGKRLLNLTTGLQLAEKSPNFISNKVSSKTYSEKNTATNLFNTIAEDTTLSKDQRRVVLDQATALKLAQSRPPINKFA